MATEKEDIEGLEWIRVKRDMDEKYAESDGSYWSKMTRKIGANPLVPVGALITAGVLMNGLYGLRQGDRAKQQRMMRYRVAAQGFTIFAILGGLLLAAMKKPPT